MCEKLLLRARDVSRIINLDKALAAIKEGEIIPTICLACSNSNEKGKCEKEGVVVENVGKEWGNQFTPNGELNSLDNLLTEICSDFLEENSSEE